MSNQVTVNGLTITTHPLQVVMHRSTTQGVVITETQEIEVHGEHGVLIRKECVRTWRDMSAPARVHHIDSVVLPA